QSFTQLLMIRVAVAIGEAGCIPPANSLIAEYFSRAERPRAFAIYMLGGPLSVAIGYFGAGWLNQFFGWRLLFVMLGVPGLVLAVLAMLTLRGPRVTGQRPLELSPRSGGQSFRQVWSSLWGNATFRHLLISFSVTSFFITGIAQWQPTFFIRSFGL